MAKHQFTTYKTSTFQHEHFKEGRNWFNKSCFSRFLQPKSLLKDGKPLRASYDEEQSVGLDQYRKDNEAKIVDYEKSMTVCNAHFVIPMARRPMVSFLKMFLPPYIFACLAMVLLWAPLGIYAITSRIAPLAFIFLAVLTRMSFFRDEIPNVPHMPYIEIVGYILNFIPVVCLIQTFVGAVR